MGMNPRQTPKVLARAKGTLFRCGESGILLPPLGYFGNLDVFF